ncbi:MAG TPA: hypothetical protein VLT33_43110, partial [Labilithrix sp.]|nr:hypothetical protein [Labilithrix sp.]
MHKSLFAALFLILGCSSGGGGGGVGDGGTGSSGTGAPGTTQPPAGATPVTVGPDLTRAPDNQVRCVDG